MTRRFVWVTVGLASLALTTIVLLAIGTAIYPGSLKWTASTLCPADQPDPFVIRTTTQDSEGTSTSFSLFCMGERGEFSEVGSWEPMLVLFVSTYAAFVGLTAVLFGLFAVRRTRRRRRDGEGPGPTPVIS